MVYEKRYSWATMDRPVSADVVGRTLERLEAQNGYVDKVSFLEVSRPVDSATHDLFEWDDSVAAEKYRLGQSSSIIRDLSIEVIECPPTERQIQFNTEEVEKPPVTGQIRSAYVNCGDSRLSSVRYTNIGRAMSDEDKRNNVLKHALEELRIFQRKYITCCEFAGVFSEIRRLEEAIGA